MDQLIVYIIMDQYNEIKSMNKKYGQNSKSRNTHTGRSVSWKSPHSRTFRKRLDKDSHNRHRQAVKRDLKHYSEDQGLAVSKFDLLIINY